MTTNDPFDDAMNAEYKPQARTFFGDVAVDIYYAVLVKGTGKVPFDPNQHDQDKRVTAITLTINPLASSRAQFPIERELIAESKEWAQITKPGLRELNTDLRAINGKWAQVELVPTGQKYTNKNGETKERTAIKFLAIFNTEDECQKASDAFWATRGNGNGSTAATQPTPNGNGNGQSDAERMTAQKFLAPLWAASGKDMNKFAQSLANNPLTSKYFDLNSPEVLSVVAA